MKKDQQNELLRLARSVLENELFGTTHDVEQYNKEEFQGIQGVFVTLKIKNNLRGCIGRIEAQKPIFDNIVELSKASAFEDHRFSPLTRKELKKTIIEISILSEPIEVNGQSSYEKILKIKPRKDGVIISAEGKKATFLPQVWDSLPIREDFVSDLCQKAGLPGNYWEDNLIEILTYQVEHFQEVS